MGILVDPGDPRGALQKAIAHAIEELVQLEERPTRGPLALRGGDELALLARGVRLALAAAASTLGECRLELPYAPMQPVLDDAGLRWCCTHPTPHCR